MKSERIILCGGATGPTGAPWKRVAPPTSVAAPPSRALYLDLAGQVQNVNLKITDISRKMAANIPSVFLDLVEIATYVYCADQALTRGGDGTRRIGADWRRSLHFYIPVRDPKSWSDDAVQSALCDVLAFLSDDHYTFDFSKLTNPPPLERYFEFGPGGGSGFAADEVMLFSGGLDSLAGAVHEAIVEGRKVVLVSHRSSPRLSPRQKVLADALSKRCKDGRILHIPVWVNKDRALSREYTQRTRSFLYASLATTVARIFGLERIRFYENGITSLNLPITPQVVGSRTTRTTHPQALDGFARLFSVLTAKPFAVESPFLWKTKAETIQVISDGGCTDLIKDTTSCSQVREQTILHTHCGRCSQCIDRRFAMLATGHAGDDPREMYKVDLLVGAREEGEERTMLESYVQTAADIVKVSDSEFFHQFDEANRVLGLVGGTTDEAATRVWDLHRRHAQGVLDVVDGAIRDHATEIREGKLPDSCLVILTLLRRYKKGEASLAGQQRSPQRGPQQSPQRGPQQGPHRGSRRPPTAAPPARIADRTIRKDGQFWKLVYAGEPVYLQDSMGIACLAQLVTNPGQDIPAIRLRSLVAGQDEELAVVSGGDVVDKLTVKDYRARLETLKERLENAERDNDLGTKRAVQEEIAAIEEQLVAAAGPGGCLRKVSDDAERARKSVSNAMRRTLKILEPKHPKLWRHFMSTLRLGAVCTYAPDGSGAWHS